jgi:hypothetical protein
MALIKNSGNELIGGIMSSRLTVSLIAGYLHPQSVETHSEAVTAIEELKLPLIAKHWAAHVALQASNS